MLLPLALPLLGATALGGTHGHVKYLSFYDYSLSCAIRTHMPFLDFRLSDFKFLL